MCRPRQQITVRSILWGPTMLHFPCTSITGVVVVRLHNSGIVLILMFLIPTIEEHIQTHFNRGKYGSRDWPQGSYDDLGVDLVYNLLLVAHVVDYIASCRRVVDSSIRRIKHATKTPRRSRSSARAGRPRWIMSTTHHRLLSSSSTDQVNCAPSLALS